MLATLLHLFAALLLWTGAGGTDTTRATASTALAFTSSNLPIVVMDTGGREIVDDPKVEVGFKIIARTDGGRNNLTDPANAFDGRIMIEIRGSSSQMFPKKSYGFELMNKAGDDSSHALLGMPKQSDWILYAPYNDKSLMRDVLAYWMSRSMGRWAARTQFVELVINGDYKGIYVLMESVKRDGSRVDVSKMAATDVAGDAVTGGYIIKIDKWTGSDNDGWNSNYKPYDGAWQNISYQYHYPKAKDIVSAQKTYIQQYMANVERAMYQATPGRVMQAAGQYIDLDSFVDHFILNEITKNVDGYRLSAYLHKARDSKGGKLRAGPVWDFNLGFGNADYYDASTIPGYMVFWRDSGDNWQIPFWWSKLVRDSTFAAHLSDRWKSLRTGVLSDASINHQIDSLSTLLQEAQVRNFQRWPGTLGYYVWPNPVWFQTYGEEVTYLKQWIHNRTAYMDFNLPKAIATSGGSDLAERGYRLSVSGSDPFGEQTTLDLVVGTPQHVTAALYDALGRRVRLLYEGQVDSTAVKRIDVPGSGLAAGVYFVRIEGAQFAATRRVVHVR